MQMVNWDRNHLVQIKISMKKSPHVHIGHRFRNLIQSVQSRSKLVSHQPPTRPAPQGWRSHCVVGGGGRIAHPNKGGARLPTVGSPPPPARAPPPTPTAIVIWGMTWRMIRDLILKESRHQCDIVKGTLHTPNIKWCKMRSTDLLFVLFSSLIS